MRKLPILPLLLVSAFLFLFLWWNNVSKAPAPADTTPRKFLIVKGQTAGKIAKELEKAGLVKNELAFRFYVQFVGKEKKIQPGNYELSPSLTLSQLVSTLVTGPKEIWVTYPEGLRREEVAIKTIKALGMEEKEAALFWTEFINESGGQEGFLFPETYLFPKDITAKKVFNKLRSTFDLKVSDEVLAAAKENGLTLEETATMASIIERETLTDEERPVVAGILQKRLKAGMPLQVDATLQYLAGNKRCKAGKMPEPACDWWKPPTVEDKKVKSSYNTYTNRGLPPSPIANPGLSSIKAAAYPQDSPYWYYLHGEDGKIHYARTIDEHNENIARYLK